MIECFVPKDQETGELYVNAVGSSQGEANAYLAQLDLPNNVLERIVLVKATLEELMEDVADG